MKSKSQKLVTAKVLAEHFTVGIETITRWARLGVIPSVRPSRRILRFDLAEVERALRAKPQRFSVGGGQDEQ